MDERPKMKFDLDIIGGDNGVASATECTGLIQVPPESDWESDAYSDIYDIPHQKNDSDDASRRKKAD